MILASPWYASDTFWVAFGAVAALVTSAVGAWVMWKTANPSRRLYYGMTTSSLLNNASENVRNNLEITWNKEVLTDPHIIDVELRGQSRRDIEKESFGDESFQFNVGAPILAILETTCNPPTPTFRAVNFKDTILEVGPALIGARQHITFTLLVDGPHPKLGLPALALRDVTVKQLSNEPTRHGVRLSLSGAVTIVTFIAAVALGVTLLHPTSAQSGLRPTTATAERVTTLAAGLNSPALSTRLNTIQTLRQIMRTTPADQPAAIRALAAFIRATSPAGDADQPVTTDIQAAATTIATRNTANDHGVTVDLSNANLTNAKLGNARLAGANLANTDFTSADLTNADLTNANLDNAYVGGADISNTEFTGANLSAASFFGTPLCTKSGPTIPARGYNCEQ